MKRTVIFLLALAWLAGCVEGDEQKETQANPSVPGPKGEKGEKGDTGAAGAQGIQGLQGVNGDKGDQGLQGVAGAQGSKGDTGASGADGKDGRDGESIFVFQQGRDGYAGAADSFISNGTGSALNRGLDTTLMAHVSSDATTNDHRILLYFDLQSISTRLGKSGCDVSVDEATLHLYKQSGDFGVRTAITLSYLDFVDSDWPLFDESVVTWDRANQNELWPNSSNGVPKHHGPEMDRMAASDKPYGGWVEFRLMDSVVRAWLCDNENNRGMIIRASRPNGSADYGGAQFPSSNFSDSEFRPKLIIRAH